MSSNPEKKCKLEDKDENCRLKHGLNVQCLEHIFQYLDSPDLYTVGEMNEFYQQIINGYVIQKHKVNFEQLFERGVTMQQVFERYGTNIKKIFFRSEMYSGWYGEQTTILQLLQSIAQYCSVDQLKSVEIESGLDGYHFLPFQFRKVERLKVHTDGIGLISGEISDALRYLDLRMASLGPNFDWTKFKNLTELRLNGVRRINADNFIAFLRQRPNLTVFHHNQETFEDITKEVCDAMAKYCGNTIEDYSGEICWDEEAARIDMYSFLSDMKNVKTVSLMTHQMCGGDLVDGMKRLAENDTIETLQINYDDYEINYPLPRCIFQERPDRKCSDMRHFSHLKTVKLVGFHDFFCEHAKVCDPYEIVRLYGSRILPNVENLTIDYAVRDWIIIESASKLRRLELFVAELTSMEAAQISTILENILQKRNNGQNNGDTIEINFRQTDIFNLFAGINGRNDAFILSLGVSVPLNLPHGFHHHNAIGMRSI